MHLLWVFWLLAGLLPGWAQSAAANMAIWNVDSSCYYYPHGQPGGTDERYYIQEGFNEALAMFESGLTSFTYVLDKRPHHSTNLAGYIAWNRIANSIQVTLGWSPRPDKKEDPNSLPWKHAFALLRVSIQTLQSNKNTPSKGYNSDLYDISDPRPMLACGEGTFAWIGLQGKVPRQSRKLKDMSSFKDDVKKGAIGAWYLQERLIPSKTGQKPVIPREASVVGQIEFVPNIFFLFDAVFSAEAKQQVTLTLVKQHNLVKEGHSLATYRNNLGTLVTHELVHWFSGYQKRHGQVKGGRSNVIDVQAVDQDGNLLYRDTLTQEIIPYVTAPTKETIKEKKLSKVLAYGQHYVFNLAVSHPHTYQQDNSGPMKAMQNADSWTTLLAMLYLDSWDWAYGGYARTPGVSYS